MKRSLYAALSLIVMLTAIGWTDSKIQVPVQLNNPPNIQADTQSIQQNPGGNSSLSVDTFANTQDFMRYEPYNTYPHELDLWNLEGRKRIRSDSVVSPDRQHFAYSEVLFMPQVRQTIAKMYLVDVPPLPAPQAQRLPSEEVTETKTELPPDFYANRFDPNKHIRDRKTLLAVGYSRVIPFAFQCLTVVDWSASGQRLLMKQRSGVLHLGLRTSDILVYDQAKGTVTIYPEIHRVIKHYWQTQGNLPHIDSIAWDIQPLGWDINSDRSILLKAWAYDREEKKFLGLWQYDFDAERTQLLSLNDETAIVAANGWLAMPIPPTPVKKKK